MSCQKDKDIVPAWVPGFAVHQLARAYHRARNFYRYPPSLFGYDLGESRGHKKFLNRQVEKEKAAWWIAAQDGTIG